MKKKKQKNRNKMAHGFHLFAVVESPDMSDLI
jgi:hypothetical protein